MKITLHTVLHLAPFLLLCLCGVNLFTGDAVGIYPENCGEDVDEVIKLAGWKATELVDVPVHAYQPVIGTEAESLILLIYLYC